MIKLGNNDTKIYLGDAEVDAIYLGTEQVYEGEPTHDYSQDYLTFNILSSGTIVWKNEDYSGHKTISYSFDSGSTWTNITANRIGRSFNVNAGDKVIFKGNNEKYCNNDIRYYHHFGGTAMFSLEGNIMSLISGDSFTSATTLSNYAFASLFYNSTGLTDASNLVLPATTLASSCYSIMFQGCASLTTAPVLSATTLAQYCYQSMFNGCTRLNYIKCLATDISASNCTSSWVNGVEGEQESPTFVRAASMNDWECGVDGIPNGWVVYDEYGDEVDGPCSPDIDDPDLG